MRYLVDSYRSTPEVFKFRLTGQTKKKSETTIEKGHMAETPQSSELKASELFEDFDLRVFILKTFLLV